MSTQRQGSRVCVVEECGNVALDGVRSLHAFPTNESVRLAWKAFVRRTRSPWDDTLASKICSDHFLPESFANLTIWKMGHCQRLELLPNAVPTIFANGILTNEGDGRQTLFQGSGWLAEHLVDETARERARNNSESEQIDVSRNTGSYSITQRPASDDDVQGLRG